jgi:hypothetical protein
MSTAMAAAAEQASDLRANSGFYLYERVAPLGRVIARMQHFSARIIFSRESDEKKRMGKTR